MDKVVEIFDEWAVNGKAEVMEREHGRNVDRFLDMIPFERQFTFLDAGCGNGWVVRKIAQLNNCKKAMGIDKSPEMIRNARSRARSSKEIFISTSIEEWQYRGRFDYIFAMESIYYSESVEDAVAKAYKLLKRGGEFFCGTDLYRENRTTSRWPRSMGVTMHLLSKDEWISIFNDAGFETRTEQIRDPQSHKKWKRDLGTLFVIGRKGLPAGLAVKP